jgi:site-specific DNA-cytosine methylase
VRAIDCQSFAGAFALGVVQSGFDYIGKREQLGGFGVPMVEGNRHLIPGQHWWSEACEPAAWTPLPADLVFGNPPCSGFSSLSTCIAPANGQAGSKPLHESGRIDWRGIDSKANECMWALIDFAARCKPQAVVFESVQQAGKTGRPLMLALRARLEERTKRRWNLTHVFQNDLSLGGCSMRKRYFFVATRAQFTYDVPDLDGVRTLRDAIGDLESRKRFGHFAPETAGHVTLNSQRARRMAWLATQPKARWAGGEQSGVAVQRLIDAGIPFPEDWWTVHGTFVRTDAGTSLYAPRRWKYDEPARVLTGLGLEENVHPTQPRTFTHREAARIMGFPDSWNCQPAIDRGHTGAKWWGKQLPVAPARWIASNVRAVIEGDHNELAPEKIGDREYLVDITNAWKAAA